MKEVDVQQAHVLLLQFQLWTSSIKSHIKNAHADMHSWCHVHMWAPDLWLGNWRWHCG